MAGKLVRTLALLAAAVSSAGASDRRATATMNVSVMVVSPCPVNADGASGVRGCEEASRRQVRVDAGRASTSSQGDVATKRITNDPNPDGSSVVLIRF